MPDLYRGKVAAEAAPFRPVDGELGHVVLVEPFVLVVTNDDRDVRLRGLKRPGDGFDSFLASVRLFLECFQVARFVLQILREVVECLVEGHGPAVGRIDELAVSAIAFGIVTPEFAWKGEKGRVGTPDTEHNLRHLGLSPDLLQCHEARGDSPRARFTPIDFK